MHENECDDLKVKARRLFAVCDREDKGFVTKRDMQVIPCYFIDSQSFINRQYYFSSNDLFTFCI